MSFEKEIPRHLPRLRAFIRRRVASAADAEDLLQETLLKAVRQQATLRDQERLGAWLHRIARTTLLDHYRRRRPQEEFVDGPAPADESRQRRVDEAVAKSAECYLGTLPPSYREAVRLADCEGLPHAEVARRLGITLTAAKSRIRRGKQRILELLHGCCRMEFDRRGRVVDYARWDGKPCRID